MFGWSDDPLYNAYGLVVCSQTNYYHYHELDSNLLRYDEIAGGCVANGVTFCGIFATGDDGWEKFLISQDVCSPY